MAEEVLARKGYLETTVDDIITRARVSRGTFYLYFRNKEEIFKELVTAVVNELFAVSRAPHEEADLRARILTGNRRYLRVFADHRNLLRSMMQVATFDPEAARVYGRLRRGFIDRTERHLRKGLRRGFVKPINVEVAAWAMGLMVEWFAYLWQGTREMPQRPPFTMDTVVETLSELWCRALYEPAAMHRASMAARNRNGRRPTGGAAIRRSR